MTGALRYLAVRSARNRLLRQLRRLRHPRYAIALLLGLGYLLAVVIWQRPEHGRADVSTGTLELLGAVGVMLVLFWTWIFSTDRQALAFTKAEVTWLFQAPLVRRQLIQYKLLRGQFVILFNVVLWTFLLARGWSGAGPWRHAAAIWILLTTLSLHRLGVALLRSSLSLHGTAALRARALTIVAIAGVLGVALADAAAILPALRTGWEAGPSEFLAAARDAATRPVANALLLPARWLVRPLMADTWTRWLQAVGPALALLALHFVWVVRSDAAFEEAAAAAALARRSRREGGRVQPVSTRPIPMLSPTGWAGGALLWKNLASVIRTGQIRSGALGFAAALLVIAGLSVAGVGRDLLEIVGWLAAVWSGFLLLLGPQWVRNDLRTDLGRLALLRSYPLRGRTVVGAETAGSTIVLTALQLGLVCVAYLCFWTARTDEPAPELRTAIAVGAIICLPAVNFLSMLVQNGLALLFPSWVRVGRERPIGVEALGHNMLGISGFLVLMAVLLLLPAVAGAGVYYWLEPRLGPWAVAPAGGLGVIVAVLEARLVLARLGRIFEATDPSAVAPVEAR
jgi:ABC-2 type transport system permease protein